MRDVSTKAPQQRRGSATPRMPARSEPAPSRTATRCARRSCARCRGRAGSTRRSRRSTAPARELAAAAAEIGIETLGDLLWHLPHGHRDRAGVARVADLRIGEQATVMVERPLGAGAPDPAAQPAARRGGGRRRQRADEGRLVQPGLPRRAPAARHPAAAQRQARPLAASASPRTRSSPAGAPDRPGRPAHDRDRPGPQRDREPARRNRLREWAGRRSTRAGDAIEPLPAELRARRGLAGRGRRAALRPLPRLARARRRAARDRLAFEELCLHQAALAMRRGARATAAPAVAIEPSRASSSTAGSARCRSSPPATSARRFDEIDADLAAGPADAAAADGGGGLGQDGGRRVRDAARARGRPPGGDDGADRDARRAARGDARQAARAARRSRSRCSPGRRPRRAGARRSTGSRTGELGLVDRHPRADRARRRVRAASPSASSTSSTASACASGRRSTPRARGDAAPHIAAHDRDPDPADALADRLRRPRRDDDPRAARPAGGRSRPGWWGRRSAPAPTASSATACARAARPTSSARWSPTRRSCGRRRRASRRSGCARGELAGFRRRPAARPDVARARRRRRWRSSSPGAPTCWSRRP